MRITNYISRLRAEVVEREAELARLRAAITGLQAHLASPKFRPDAPGERRDWIATADVDRWLRDALTG